MVQGKRREENDSSNSDNCSTSYVKLAQSQQKLLTMWFRVVQIGMNQRSSKTSVPVLVQVIVNIPILRKSFNISSFQCMRNIFIYSYNIYICSYKYIPIFMYLLYRKYNNAFLICKIVIKCIFIKERLEKNRVTIVCHICRVFQKDLLIIS